MQSHITMCIEWAARGQLAPALAYALAVVAGYAESYDVFLHQVRAYRARLLAGAVR